MVFLFFFQNYICRFYSFNIELIENLVFFFFKTLLIAIVFLHMVFFVFFFPKLSLSILFFNIELVKNYNYIMWGKHCNFPRKLLWIATMFFST
jgi:hypothetical protein